MTLPPTHEKLPTAHVRLTRVGSTLVDIRHGVEAIRTLRASLLETAYAISGNPKQKGMVLLVDSAISRDRISREWQLASGILHPDVLCRLGICLLQDGQFHGLPRDPNAPTRRALQDLVSSRPPPTPPLRPDFSFVLQKILLLLWLTRPAPITSHALGLAAGCSYPVVARTLKSLGSLIERASDRRVSLRWFPQEILDRLSALSPRARHTLRYADQSGQPRSPEFHIRRLAKIPHPVLAIGGTLGALHHHPKLDVVGAPRLDLSIHSPGKEPDLSWIEHLDPALQRVENPHAPANLVVHTLQHADPFFSPRKGGLNWADPIECLLDLREARLDHQASGFLEALIANRPAP